MAIICFSKNYSFLLLILVTFLFRLSSDNSFLTFPDVHLRSCTSHLFWMTIEMTFFATFLVKLIAKHPQYTHVLSVLFQFFQFVSMPSGQIDFQEYVWDCWSLYFGIDTFVTFYTANFDGFSSLSLPLWHFLSAIFCLFLHKFYSFDFSEYFAFSLIHKGTTFAFSYVVHPVS